MIPTRIARSFQRLRRDRAGNVAVVFSLAAPVIGLLIGGAIDYSRALSARGGLQSLADTAALAGAQASRLGNATQNSISQTVINVVAAGSRGAAISSATTVGANNASVTVKLDRDVTSTFGAFVGQGSYHLSATATAKVSGGSPLCIASLATTDPKLAAVPSPTTDMAGKMTLAALAIDVALLPNPGILMLHGAKMTAPSCIVSTNLAKSYSVAALDTARLTARSILSGGGYTGTVGVNYSVTPATDNPASLDPLSGFPAPTVGACDFNNMTVSGGVLNLSPGVYCGGLHITGAANVTMMPGVYVIKDGGFTVDSGSTVAGSGVGFYLTATLPATGSKIPTLYFGSNTHISLVAPTAGALAGILFFEDRALPTGALHAILSNDARTLLGTIYLPRGFLGVASTMPVADQSAYTIIVANAMLLYGGPELVLNTNYSGSIVPVPFGVGNNRGGSVSLSQ